MNKPTVAIVGRPNVGKSTLFNRILGGRDAIVSEVAGTTRDRHFGDAEWNGRHFWLVDTGGLMPGSSDSMDRAVRAQVEIAVEEADAILFVVDGKEGLNPVDREIAAQLRKVKRPILLAVNKLDDYPRTTNHLDFYELGFGDPLPVSAAVGKASGDLLDAVVAILPAKGEGEDETAVQVAVIGLPNAGKSSLINKLLGEERLVVSAQPGTTRDAIDTPLRYHSKTLNFIDTAGLRRRAKVQDDIEFYSTLRMHRAVERADVCVLVVDAKNGLHTQDLRIATEAWDRGAGLVIAVNKWDLIPEKDANTAKRGEDLLIEKAPFLRVCALCLYLGQGRAAGGADSRPDSGSGGSAGKAGADQRSEPGAGRADPAQRPAPAARRGSEAAVCLTDRHPAARHRDRDQSAGRCARGISAISAPWIPGGLGV